MEDISNILYILINKTLINVSWKFYIFISSFLASKKYLIFFKYHQNCYYDQNLNLNIIILDMNFKQLNKSISNIYIYIYIYIQ